MDQSDQSVRFSPLFLGGFHLIVKGVWWVSAILRGVTLFSEALLGVVTNCLLFSRGLEILDEIWGYHIFDNKEGGFG